MIVSIYDLQTTAIPNIKNCRIELKEISKYKDKPGRKLYFVEKQRYIIYSNSKYDLHWLEQRDLKKAFS